MFSKFIFKKWFIFFVLFTAVALATYFYFWGGGSQEFQTAKAIRGDMIHSVSVTGRVKPAQSVNLAFEKSGRVRAVNVQVSDRVLKGQTLVQLENLDILAQLKAEEAKLEELRAGSSVEELNVQKVKMANAETALNDAKPNLMDKINDSFIKADDAVRNKVDQFISNPK